MIEDWFADAQSAPEQARREWTGVGVALLPLGTRFVAVRLPEALVHTAVETTHPQELAASLARLLNGPVIFDGRTMGGTYYALTRPLIGRPWEHQTVAPRLGSGTYLGVPKLSRLEPPGTYWVVPPRFEGDLCKPGSVESLISYALSVSQEAEQ
ncbi:hypothetical protein [Streptomyces sp. KN37]|uniref:hypothetical protein n=1 Tax=Streptomyces sp. KN37 TaxID=3090667 RepID=UPI002A75735D|nr:hypothetical protein [Streptomyces sp. KN37]WPO76254.1 hypothetical protein R9806_36875 [Streptomyces sp. KN37]